MLIPIKVLSETFSINPKSILHVGAHLGEERGEYIAHGWGKHGGIVWVEAQKELCEDLMTMFDESFSSESVINALVWNEDNIEKTFHISNSTQSSSILAFGQHSKLYPSIVTVKSITLRTSRLDSIIQNGTQLRKFDFVNLDIQGVELQALQGMGSILDDVVWIYSEVNFEEMYRDCSRISEIDDYLSPFGFKRQLTKKAIRGGWGDALYVKNPSIGFRLRCIFWSIHETLMLWKHLLCKFYRRLRETCGG